MKLAVILTILLIPALSSESTGFKSILEKECRKSGVSVRLMTNLIQAESSGNPYALGKLIKINHNGRIIYTKAVGLCQIIPEYHYQGDRNDLYNPLINIKIGIKVYKQCLRKAKGNQIKALRYYNGQVLNKDDRYIKKILGI